MKEIKRLIAQISGHRNRECYLVLACAVEAALSDQPQEPKMETIVKRTAVLLGGRKNPAAVSRALSRVAEDIWERGNRPALSRLFGYQLQEPPAPKELVFRLAEYLWTREKHRAPRRQVNYQVVRDLSGEGYGITATLQSPAYSAATSAFCPDRETADRLVRRLNAEQLPLPEFEELYLSGTLLHWLESRL